MMKQITTFSILLCLLFACNESPNSHATGKEELKKQNDSLKNIADKMPEDTVTLPNPATATGPVENVIKAGVHPISVQWISWDKKGEAVVTPTADGWYIIKGRQANAEKDYLNIDGKIKRISENELEFEGTIEVRVHHNNGGEACIKKGAQRFFAKGNRTYFRMQDMENCAGGNLVDYVDIYPGTSSL